jgi:hypothetical protein
LPKYKIFAKIPWPGQNQPVGRFIIIEATNAMTAVLQVRGQYGTANVIGGALEIKELSSNTDMFSEIKKLNDLYKSGALTKVGFKKAKAKILK